MVSEAEFWIEAGVIAAVAALIPIYMGFVHAQPLMLGLYAVLGGIGMALGETLQFNARPANAREFAVDSVTWGTGIAAVGGVGYGLALLLI